MGSQCGTTRLEQSFLILERVDLENCQLLRLRLLLVALMVCPAPEIPQAMLHDAIYSICVLQYAKSDIMCTEHMPFCGHY